jgi:hypothetical protein
MDILASTLGNVDVVCIVKRRWEGAEKGKKNDKRVSCALGAACLLSLCLEFGPWWPLPLSFAHRLL